MSQQINLFNPIFLQQRKVFAANAMVPALAVLVLGIAALATYSQFKVAALEEQAVHSAQQLERRQARLQSAAAELAPRQKSAALEAEVALLESRVQALRQVGSFLQQGNFGNTQGYAEYFRAFARQHMPGIWLTGLSIDHGGRDIAVEGRALNAEMVPGYIAKLSGEAVLRGRTFNSLRIATAAAIEPAAGAAPSAASPAASAPYVEFQLQASPPETTP